MLWHSLLLTWTIAVHSILHMDSPEESPASNAEGRSFQGMAAWQLQALPDSPEPSPDHLSTPQLLKQIAKAAATEVPLRQPLLCCH